MIKLFRAAFESFWFADRKFKPNFACVQRWFKQLCLNHRSQQQFTCNVTTVITRSMRDLETRVVELQGLADSTGVLFDSLKSKMSALANLLGIAAQGALVRSCFLDITQMVSSFLVRRGKMDRDRLFTLCDPAAALQSQILLRLGNLKQKPQMCATASSMVFLRWLLKPMQS